MTLSLKVMPPKQLNKCINIKRFSIEINRIHLSVDLYIYLYLIIFCCEVNLTRVTATRLWKSTPIIITMTIAIAIAMRVAIASSPLSVTL
mmetsp:Transcript_92654/g.264686  ORF Transcript_92654/g.264686 Transcript_92654/m.264686 type:complete len:90 (-) Transcript_92654:117-386(-)